MSATPLSPRRSLGRTGFRASALGIGDVADRKLGLEACVAAVRRALDAGLNVLDTAPNYENGFSEEILGEALAGRPRESVFVVDKLDDYAPPLVRPQIESALRRMKLERIDLVVFHGVKRLEDWRTIAREGAWDELGRLQAEGLVRFRGVSAHHPDVLRAAILCGQCDVVLMPVGPFVDQRYVARILPLARACGVGTIAFKTFAAGKLLADPARCVTYTLSLDPDVALLGMSTPAEVDVAVAAARAARPLSLEDERATRVWAREQLAGKGPFWWNADPEAVPVW